MELKDMIKEHVALTNSEKGKKILDNFSEYLPKFKKKSYRMTITVCLWRLFRWRRKVFLPNRHRLRLLCKYAWIVCEQVSFDMCDSCIFEKGKNYGKTNRIYGI